MLMHKYVIEIFYSCEDEGYIAVVPELPGDGGTPSVEERIPEEGFSLEEHERRLVERALSQAGGNQTKAAKLLGISRRTLIYRMEKHGLK